MFRAGNPHRGEPMVWSSSPERGSVATTEGSFWFREFQLRWKLKLGEEPYNAYPARCNVYQTPHHLRRHR